MTHESSKIQININSELKRFKEHLQSESNIFFSGIFGSGKTYFLKKLIEENNSLENPNYNFYYLSPVKYSVSSNEDIFRYIKFDIGFQMFSKGIDFEKSDITFSEMSGYFLKEHSIEIIKELSKISGVVGNVSKLIESIHNVKSKYLKFNSETQIDDENELKLFLKQTVNRDGSIYEENLITELISNYIQDENNVLIVDDLDRLDPNHVFRILNVLSCHLGVEDSVSNKLGFNKVILVGDINNIKHIYKHLYGENVDFYGYIDKFYSSEIFNFNNTRVVLDTVSDILDESLPEELNDNKSHFYFMVQSLLVELILNSNLNLRSLLSLTNNKYRTRNTKIIVNKEIKFYSGNFELYNVFSFLISLLGDSIKLSEYLETYIQRVPIKILSNTEIHNYRHIFSFLQVGRSFVGGHSYTCGEVKIDYEIKSYPSNKFGYEIFYGFLSHINDTELKELRTFEFPLGQFYMETYKIYLKYLPFEQV